MQIKHDGQVDIAIGKNRKSKSWQNKKIKWSDLLNKLSDKNPTSETIAEYEAMTKEQRDNIKDVGGFVGGKLKSNGRRSNDTVESRSLLTLDIDFGTSDIWDNIKFLYEFACCIYSTHSHTPEKPRYRLIIPLNREVTPEEYQAISRMIADEIDIELFDDTTYEPARFMYWQSTPKDADYIFDYQDSQWLNPDDVLSKYTFGWQDASYWPQSSRVIKKINNLIKNKQQDPTTKTSYIGAFCRTYTIYEAIDTFLSDEYIQGKDSTRYTYIKGHSSNGLAIIDDMFAYSHQDTDPISGKGACNAFDLIRIHKFGHLDNKEDLEQLESKGLKSFKRMCEFVANDEKASKELLKEEFESVNYTDNEYKANTKKKRDIKFIPLGDSLLESPIKEYDFLINRLLYDNAINLISGDPKTYKTFVGIDIALGVSTGSSAIGHTVLKQGKVLFISTEFDVRKRFLDLMRGRELDTNNKEITNKIIPFDFNSLDTFQWKKDFHLLEDLIKEYTPKLIVIDPLSYIFDGDINKNDEVAEFFKELKLLVNMYNLSVLIIHHNNRMNEVKRMNNVSGASAITRFVDSIIYLERFEEDEKQDINKSDEEIDSEIKPIKMIKGQYRHGQEGYKYYSINFKIKKDIAQITAERYDIKKEFEEQSSMQKPRNITESLEDSIIQALEESKLDRDKFTFSDVLAVINNNYSYSESYFEKSVRNVLKGLVEDKKWLIKEGRGYRYPKVF